MSDIESGTKSFVKNDNTSLVAEFVWIPLFAVPMAISWRRGWNVAMWIFAGLTVLVAVLALTAVFQRNDAKWRTSVSFAQWPVPLGGPTMMTVEFEALNLEHDGTASATTNGPVSLEITLTCEEDFEEKVSSTRTELGDSGKKETETVIDRTETFTLHLVGGHGSIEIPLMIPVDRGAPTQVTKVPPLSYRVTWNAKVRAPDLGRTLMDDEITVAAVWQAEEGARP